MSLIVSIDPCYGPKSVLGMALMEYLEDRKVLDYAFYTYHGHRLARQWTGDHKAWYAGMAHACALGWAGRRDRCKGEAPIICIEGPRGQWETTTALREFVGMLKERFNEWGWETVEVTATAAKKALTGDGNADKDDMVEAANKMIWLMDLTKKQQEAVADAIGIGLAGADKWEAEHKDKP